MKQYLDLLSHILENGYKKSDRTGTGTISSFGHQMRFDLSEGFPLLTTKKLHTKSIFAELLWFISGDTNNNNLVSDGVKIWNEWADKNGNLGKIYSAQWRYVKSTSGRFIPVDKKHPVHVDYKYEPAIALKRGKNVDIVYNLWATIMNACHCTSYGLYNVYGGYGVTVNPEWHNLGRFIKDISKIKGYSYWIKDPKRYELSYNYFGAAQYGKDTSIFVDRRCNYLKHVETEGYCLYREEEWIDQLDVAINDIKNNSDSRRIIVNSWNVSELDDMALPPCHSFFQFYVAGGKLSCQMYQRSGDMFLGVPFNIASYALLTHMVAKECGLEVGEFIHTLGDAHIYMNHVEQCKMQLKRDTRELPRLVLSDGVGFFDYTLDDIRIEGYDPHPHIKGDVSV